MKKFLALVLLLCISIPVIAQKRDRDGKRRRDNYRRDRDRRGHDNHRRKNDNHRRKHDNRRHDNRRYEDPYRYSTCTVRLVDRNSYTVKNYYETGRYACSEAMRECHSDRYYGERCIQGSGYNHSRRYQCSYRLSYYDSYGSRRSLTYTKSRYDLVDACRAAADECRNKQRYSHYSRNSYCKKITSYNGNYPGRYYSSHSNNDGQIIGAIAGGTLGAVIGSEAGDEEAVIGAVLGGVLGAVIGDAID